MRVLTERPLSLKLVVSSLKLMDNNMLLMKALRFMLLHTMSAFLPKLEVIKKYHAMNLLL